MGVSYGNYYASEIDKHAIKLTQHHFPNTIQLGDVTQIKGEDLPKIDLLIGGSPCQGFSFSGKQLNFNDPRSSLFFEFVRLLKETNPKYFLLENVKMKKEYEEVISEYLGVEPIVINSSLVSAQNRVRLYWTNIPNVTQPEDKGIKLSDILESDDNINPAAVRGRKLNKATILGRRLNQNGKREDYNKNIPITQCLEVRGSNTDKSNCITTVAKDNVLTNLPIGRYPDAFNNKLPFRYYTLKEYCRLQTVPDNYFDNIVSENQAKKMLGNGWTVNVIIHIFEQIKNL
jgi:DNA (cytosine-5)-methyltransferase 3A